MKNALTPPVKAGPITLGTKEAETFPFEPTNVDYSHLNARLIKDPTYGQARIPDSIVNSCSECCMERINGKPNLLRILHRNMVKNCSSCPVTKSAARIQARDGNGNPLYKTMPDGSVRPIMENEAVLLDIDGSE